MNTAPRQPIDWSSAKVEDGALTVALEGDRPRGWAKRFRTVLGLLNHAGGRWGAIRLRKGMIEVAAVEPGSEEELRHLLESAVVQTAADVDGDAQEPELDEEEREQVAADRRMTEVFRAFAATSR